MLNTTVNMSSTNICTIDGSRICVVVYFAFGGIRFRFG